MPKKGPKSFQPFKQFRSRKKTSWQIAIVWEPSSTTVKDFNQMLVQGG